MTHENELPEADPRNAPTHRLASSLVAEIESAAATQTDAEIIAIEAEVVASCMVALARLPRLRREAVIRFLSERLAAPSILDILGGIARETAPVIEKTREDARQLRVANEHLKKRIRELERLHHAEALASNSDIVPSSLLPAESTT